MCEKHRRIANNKKIDTARDIFNGLTLYLSETLTTELYIVYEYFGLNEVQRRQKNYLRIENRN